jgi:hypothetical protein
MEKTSRPTFFCTNQAVFPVTNPSVLDCTVKIESGFPDEELACPYSRTTEATEGRLVDDKILPPCMDYSPCVAERAVATNVEIRFI